MRNHRSAPILFAAVLALVLAPAASAQQIALQNSGLDEYTEDVPEAGDEGPVDGGDGSDDGSPESDPGTTSSSDPTAVDSGTTSSSTPTTGAPTEEQVTSGSGSTPDGQLPATGLETLLLALSGAGLLALGLYIRKAATG